jgi:predicted transposase/invertase (TIGR01784 family)
MCKVNPRVDFAFKLLFGKEENKDILIDFLNAILAEGPRIKDLQLRIHIT